LNDMGRITRAVGYGLAGFVLAISLSAAAFGVAGRSLSESGQGVSVNGAPGVAAPTARTTWSPSWSPSSAPTHKRHHREGEQGPTAPTPAPSTDDNGGSSDNSGPGSGDDSGGHGSDDNHGDD
jgi:hypothetical protein